MQLKFTMYGVKDKQTNKKKKINETKKIKVSCNYNKLNKNTNLPYNPTIQPRI